jgi:outer membrane protein
MARSFVVLGCLMALSGLANAQSATAGEVSVKLPRSASVENPVSLKDFAGMIGASDELVRVQRLEESIADEGIRGAASIFQPIMFMSLEREGSYVLNSSQDAQRRGQDPGDIFSSTENRLKAGLALKSQYGTDIELSYNTSELVDSIQPTRLPKSTIPEYRGSVGIKLTQPLLRGAGSNATLAGIMIAQTEKGVARETVRQVTAQRLMEGITAYTLVQRAQARVRLRTMALQVAADIEKEMTLQQSAGLRSVSELAESQSSLALRRAQLAQAQQDFEEQSNALQVFVSAQNRLSGAAFVETKLAPGDPLELLKAVPAIGLGNTLKSDNPGHLDAVMERRPEARVVSIRKEREDRKVDAARDQKLPELNFVLRMGKDDLSGSNRPINQYFTNSVPYNTWQVGVTYRMALFSDDKKGSEYQAAVYRRQQAELAQDAIRQRIANEVQASDSLTDKALQQVKRQTEIVQAQRSLFKIENQLLAEGRRSTLDAKKKQLELFLAEEALADAVAQANRASFLAAQVDGSLLVRLGLE